jgi:hypothetical protein
MLHGFLVATNGFVIEEAFLWQDKLLQLFAYLNFSRDADKRLGSG